MIYCLRERQKDESLAAGLLRIKTDISLTLFSLSRYGQMTLSARILLEISPLARPSHRSWRVVAGRFGGSILSMSGGRWPSTESVFVRGSEEGFGWIAQLAQTHARLMARSTSTSPRPHYEILTRCTLRLSWHSLMAKVKRQPMNQISHPDHRRTG